jgi:hypothetical protein
MAEHFLLHNSVPAAAAKRRLSDPLQQQHNTNAQQVQSTQTAAAMLVILDIKNKQGNLRACEGTSNMTLVVS